MTRRQRSKLNRRIRDLALLSEDRPQYFYHHLRKELARAQVIQPPSSEDSGDEEAEREEEARIQETLTGRKSFVSGGKARKRKLLEAGQAF